MRFVVQTLEEIVGSLRPLTVQWQDVIATRVIECLHTIEQKEAYTAADVQSLLDQDFDEGILICQLFLGVSKDQLTGMLREARGEKGIGVKSYRANRTKFIDDLQTIGLLNAMAEVANRKVHWTDVLVERLRSGRGSAIAGQRRGRDVEDFAEAIVRKVFDTYYESRRTFAGLHGRNAKCDFAIPSKEEPRILIEAKGYGATGSKMTDILGDVRTIIAAKRSDTAFLFFTDGTTWNQRKSDLRKLVEFQNNGDITRIYTRAMAEQFEKDLRQLKSEHGL